jgi:hypothetical protein
MTTFKGFVSLVLPATIAFTLAAETRCPGNTAIVPLRAESHHKMIVEVSLNHSGPYNFLLDTGTQITMVDPSLAAQLHLDTQGAAVVAGAGSRQSASFTQIDLLEVGSYSVVNQNVLVYDLQNLRSADLKIQGVLGEDFLEHFDMRIDNSHRLLCLDDTGAMRAAVKGPHVPLLAQAGPAVSGELAALPIIAVRLSDGMRPVRLMLDSGAADPILYNTSRYMALQLTRSAYLRGSGVDGEQRIFSALPPQDVKIGSRELSSVPFFSLAGFQEDAVAKGFDGVLTTGLFLRVFIDHADHFAVLE